VTWFKAYFDVLNRLGVTDECDKHTDGRTDGRTDILVTSAAVNYTVRCAAKMLKLFTPSEALPLD